jgi:taurine--2-oxoglutarate transaminase
MATIAPGYAVDVRSEAARLIASKAPDGLEMVFFTNGGAEATENAIRMARLHTGRHKVLAAYRSYHGATAGALTMTGDPRRVPSEPGLPGIVHFWGPYPYRSAFHSNSPEQETERALAHLRDTIMVEGPGAVAAIMLETVVGTNGVLVPPPGYLAGVRAICDELGIVMIADEVMAGFARCGEWFAIQHWGVTPDLITFAKGVNSGYVPIGGVIISNAIAATFRDRVYPGGLTYSGHPLACASAVASIQIFEEEGVVEHARMLGAEVIGPELARIAARPPQRRRGPRPGRDVGRSSSFATARPASRSCPTTRLGLPRRRWRSSRPPARSGGLWPFVHFNRTHVVPPCTTSVEEVREGLAILDEALTVADRHTTSG